MKRNSLLLNKIGGSTAKVGIDLGISAIFILAIGLVITVEVINNISTGLNVSVSGITATVAQFAPLIIVAGFIFFVAKLFGMV